MISKALTFNLGLPEGWVPVPLEVASFDEWAAQRAASLVAGVETAPGAEEFLALQLADVARAAAAPAAPGVQCAALVREPAGGAVDAMLTIFVRPGDARRYMAELEASVAESEQVMHAQAIESEVQAGKVRGAHLLFGHLDPDDGEGVAHLEERVDLGVFPPWSTEFVEMVVIASSVGVFDDIGQAAVDLLVGLDVEKVKA